MQYQCDQTDWLYCIRWHVLSVVTASMELDTPIEMMDSTDLGEELKLELEDTVLYQHIKLGTKQSLAKACRLIYTLQRHEVQLRSLKDRRYEREWSHNNDGYSSPVSPILPFPLSHPSPRLSRLYQLTTSPLLLYVSTPSVFVIVYVFVCLSECIYTHWSIALRLCHRIWFH